MSEHVKTIEPILNKQIGETKIEICTCINLIQIERRVFKIEKHLRLFCVCWCNGVVGIVAHGALFI